MQLCFATNNPHKLQEVKALLEGTTQVLSLAELGCAEEIPETQDTIAANAMQKANYVWDHYQVPCFADDTGLEVNALNGAPGVFSARYAGPQRNSNDNIRLVLKNMSGVVDRGAQFKTVIALRLAQGEFLFEGILRGDILHEGRGSLGFGYDPLFLPIGFPKTLAEMTMEEKNKISHRAVAVEKLVRFIHANPFS